MESRNAFEGIRISWLTPAVCALACFAIAPLAALASSDLDIPPLELAAGIGVGVAIGIALRKQVARLGESLALAIIGVCVALVCTFSLWEEFLAVHVIVCALSAGLFASKLTLDRRTLALSAIGGVLAANFAMPLLFATFITMNLGDVGSWRLALLAVSATAMVSAVLTSGRIVLPSFRIDPEPLPEATPTGAVISAV